MRLMNARTEMLDRQRKIHRIQIVEIMAAKQEAGDGNRACKQQEVQPVPGDHAVTD